MVDVLWCLHIDIHIFTAEEFRSPFTIYGSIFCTEWYPERTFFIVLQDWRLKDQETYSTIAFYGSTFIHPYIWKFSGFFSAVTNSWKVHTQNLCKKCPYNRKDYLAKMQQHSARCHCCRVCILEGRWTLYCISFISKLLPKKSIVVAQHLHQTNISNILSVVGRLAVGIVFESKEMLCRSLAFSNSTIIVTIFYVRWDRLRNLF